MAELLADTELSGEQRRYLDIMVVNGNGLAGVDQQYPRHG
jgi:hypothetical protein